MACVTQTAVSSCSSIVEKVLQGGAREDQARPSAIRLQASARTPSIVEWSANAEVRHPGECLPSGLGHRAVS